MEDKSTISIFIDDEAKPIASFATPVNFELDTRKLTDGEHLLTIVSKDVTGKEGLRKIPFVVRNGPVVSIEGIREHDIVDGIVPLMINAYGKGHQKKFIIEGSETPQSVPSWIWVLAIAFVSWAIYYVITSLSM
jgi:ABC-type uncharacterized transport system ATPase subunit